MAQKKSDKKYYPKHILEEPCQTRKTLAAYISQAHLLTGLSFIAVEGITASVIGGRDWYGYNQAGKFEVSLGEMEKIKAGIEAARLERAAAAEREGVLA